MGEEEWGYWRQGGVIRERYDEVYVIFEEFRDQRTFVMRHAQGDDFFNIFNEECLWR
jgi:hypothetical protein